jgi:glycosyltransferase involved in cell wall biosynthesis
VRVVVLGSYAPSLIQFRAPLLRAMVARGHAVTTMAADGTPAIRDALDAIGVAYEDVPLERAGTDPTRDLRTIAALTRRFRAIAPDVVFAYTMKPVLYGHLAARIAGVARRAAMITGLGYTFLGQDRWRRRVLRRAVSTGFRIALAGADHVFVQNADDLRDLDAAGALPRGVPRTIVRGSGVDVEHWAPAPVPDGPPVFVFVGRLLREKGIDDFVEMARRVRAKHPDARFVAVGSVDPNPASVSARDLASWKADGIIDYRGEIPDVRPLLASCHALVLPSYREGTPRSVLEAMAVGRPVIVSDVPGCRDTIVDGEHGFIVPVRDPAALAEAAGRVIADPARVRAMGARARARVESLYDARAVAAVMLDAMDL